jgi:ribonuclease D
MAKAGREGRGQDGTTRQSRAGETDHARQPQGAPAQERRPKRAPRPATQTASAVQLHAGHVVHQPRTVHSRPRVEAALDTAGYSGGSAQQITVPAWQRRLLIERPADLMALAQELSRARLLAVDAEFVQVRVRNPDEPSHRLALIQLAFDNNYRASYVVDALRIADLSPLRGAFESPAVLKIFHGIGADARVLASRGLIPQHTLDIEAVSRALFGQRESGLQTMLQRAASVRLDKSLQRADWARRPLTPAMVAYAARDAEMTYALYGWLSTHYSAMVAVHLNAADEPAPAVASWILPYLEGSRPRPAALAVTEAGLDGDIAAQERTLREALVAVRQPPQRARVIRLIGDLELVGLAPELREFLDAPAAEERAGAARTLGRLYDRASILSLRPLLEDPVQDVRQAARTALDHLETGRRPAPRRAPHGAGSAVWSSGGSEPENADWRQRLRARFTGSEEPAPDED